MRLTCLCPTYGRFRTLRESLTCFLMQDCQDAELLIWNFHQVPLRLDREYPHVRLINEPHNLDNNDTWLAGLEMVQTPLVRIWVDDDLYLPWANSQALRHIDATGRPAVMPAGRYQYRRHIPFVYYDQDHNDGGGSVQLISAARGQPLAPGSDAIRMPPETFLIPMGDELPSWVLTASDEDGTDQRKSHFVPRSLPRAERDRVWRSKQLDTGAGQLLSPASIGRHLFVLKHFCPELVPALARYGL